MHLNLPQAKKSSCLQSSWERESKTWESQACLPREREEEANKDPVEMDALQE